MGLSCQERREHLPRRLRGAREEVRGDRTNSTAWKSQGCCDHGLVLQGTCGGEILSPERYVRSSKPWRLTTARRWGTEEATGNIMTHTFTVRFGRDASQTVTKQWLDEGPLQRHGVPRQRHERPGNEPAGVDRQGSGLRLWIQGRCSFRSEWGHSRDRCMYKDE